MKNLLNAIEQANKLAQAFGLQFFAYVSDGKQKEHLASNLVLSDLETVIGGLREWRTGPIPEPTEPSVLVLERKQNFTRGVIMFLTDMTHDVLIWGVPNKFTPSSLLKYFPESYTGRWYIQNINLPKQ